jgi:hypothetical protein
MDSHAATKAPGAKTWALAWALGALCAGGSTSAALRGVSRPTGVSWRHDGNDAFGVKKTYLVGGITMENHHF